MEKLTTANEVDQTLDPKDWTEIRALGHQMIDDVMDLLQNIHKEPVWKKIPAETKAFYGQPIPLLPSSPTDVYDEFRQHIFRFYKGNIHPRFFAWVEGTGTPMGVLAELLAAGMNPNVGIGEHAAMYIDKQVIDWCKQMLHYPMEASGILLSGGSMANITGLAVARNHQLQKNIRKEGVRTVKGQMLLYCSTETHSCMQKAAEVLGLGTDAVRKIKVDDNYQIDINELVNTIEADLLIGHYPFCIVGNAGTVNTGAIDPLDDLLEISRKYHLWLHIDGAFGALAKLTPEFASSLKAIEEADSVAFDLHKWMYMPYEVGCVLIKNAQAHRDAFAVTPSYLVQSDRGLAGGLESNNSYGMELSRGFKSLKVWMSIKEHGLKKYAAMIGQNIQQCFYMSELVEKEPKLELLTPVTMNIVCYRYKKVGLADEALNQLNKEIIIQLQERGIASPSSTVLNGCVAIRIANVNQRSKLSDFRLIAKETVAIGDELLAGKN